MSKNMNNWTREGRENIDKLVKKALGKKPLSRAEVAEKTGIPVEPCSAALKRLAAKGEAQVEGSRGTTKYLSA